MNKNKMAPPIRFQGFTGDWEQRKIGDCFTERKESMPKGELLSVTINEGIKRFSELERHDSSNQDKSKYRKVCIGDIAYNSMRMWQGASGFSDYEGIVSPAYTVLKPHDGIDVRFVSYLFKTKDLIHVFQINSQGITSDNWNLKFPVLSTINIKIPEKIEEQNKIAEFLAKLDNLITLHQRKLEQQKKLKAFFLKNMFPEEGETVPRIRFKGFTGDWEQRKLEICFSLLQNNTLSRDELGYENGLAMNVHYGDVLIKFDECLDVSKESLPFIKNQLVADKFRNSYLKNGDVVVADTAEDETVGKCTEIMGVTNQKVISGLHTIPFRPNDKFATGYLGFYLNSAAYHNQLIPLIQGTKVSSISKSAMQKTVIKYPASLEEQELIGRYFMKFDNLITYHQRKLDQLQVMKKFMLQNLFV
jgi:type I restriction enzyme S subunit